MRVAITGARGALGSAVTAAAVAQGHSVLAVDRPGTVAGSQDSGPGSEQVDADLTDFAVFEQLVKGCDALIHLAAYLSPRVRPEPEVHHNNVMTSYNALAAAASAGIDTIVLASSINAIGGAYSRRPRYDWFPLTEQHPTYSEDPYSLSKWVAEVQAADFARRRDGVRIASLRFHALMRDQAQLRQWLERFPQAGLRELWGYTRMDDAAAACLSVLDADFTGAEAMYVVAPTTSSERPSLDLRNEHYPSIPVVGDLSGRRAFFDCSKAERLLRVKLREL